MPGSRPRPLAFQKQTTVQSIAAYISFQYELNWITHQNEIKQFVLLLIRQRRLEYK